MPTMFVGRDNVFDHPTYDHTVGPTGVQTINPFHTQVGDYVEYETVGSALPYVGGGLMTIGGLAVLGGVIQSLRGKEPPKTVYIAGSVMAFIGIVAMIGVKFSISAEKPA